MWTFSKNLLLISSVICLILYLVACSFDMKKNDTKIPGVYILSSDIYQDSRGFFTECLNVQSLKEVGIDFVPLQVNHSFNIEKGTLRGLHFQLKPFEQTKIVTCLKGAIFDVAVDLRPQSESFLKFISFLILEQNLSQDNIPNEIIESCDNIVKYPHKVLIPKGFAHGYLTLQPNTDVLYFTDVLYSRIHDSVIRFDDPQIGIKWPKISKDFIISDKDRNAPYLEDFDLTLL